MRAKLVNQHLYKGLIVIWGLAALAWSLIQTPLFDDPFKLLGLCLLAASAQVIGARHAIKGSAIQYEVGSAVAMAALPHYGIAGAICVIASSELISWLYVTRDTEWVKRAWDRLGVNIGMHAAAFTAAGSIWLAAQAIEPLSYVLLAAIWVGIVLVQDQVNFAVLAVLLQLIQGAAFNVREFWLSNRWAMFINTVVTSVGGGVLAYAVYAYDWLGVVIFFLPTLLSMYSFQAYVKRYQQHMDELEMIVAMRTAELQSANEELASSNAQLSTLNSELHEANSAKDRFLAVLSHDMRSPLTGITLYGQMMQRRPDMSADRRAHMLQVVMQNTQTLVELVDNIVEIEQFKNGEQVLDKEVVDLNALLHEVAFNFEAHAVEKSINIDMRLSPSPVVISADRQLVKRVLTNLVSNAIKYTPSSGNVTLTVREDDGEANIRVADTGVGIPANEIEQIFDAYHRVDAHRVQAKGLGLGLSIVKRYVELHKGEIFVTSRVGEGSQFNIYLPLAHSVAAPLSPKMATV